MGWWETVLPALLPGLYEVSMDIKDAGYGTLVYGSVPLAVMEPDDELLNDTDSGNAP
jgi:hypothetical protein